MAPGAAAQSRSVVSVMNAPPLTLTEGQQFNGQVAVVADVDPSATAANLTVTIDWGDNSSSAATLVQIPSAKGSSFAVSGTHVYSDEGVFLTMVSAQDLISLTSARGASSTTVREGDLLTGTGVLISATEGVAFNSTIATFTDSYATTTASQLSATINWGDGATSAGTVSGSNGHFAIDGGHTYSAPGKFGPVVTLSENAPGTASSTAAASVIVFRPPPPVTAETVASTEGQAFSGQVAIITVGDPTASVAGFTALIDWGDGTSSAGTLVEKESTSGKRFGVNGTHTYLDEGAFTVQVLVQDVRDAFGAASTGVATATVVEEDVLTGTGLSISATEGLAFNSTIATFTDSYSSTTPSQLSATIDWGDGTTSAGTVSGGNGNFAVSGGHTYAVGGLTEHFTVTLGENTPGVAHVTANGLATVGADGSIKGEPSGPGATPELDSLVLFGSGLAGLGGFALVRLRARRRKGVES